VSRNDLDEPRDYDVGFGRPPEHGKFKPGRSGNPRGRPKGSLNLATVLLKAAAERVVVNEGGKKKAITKLEATAKQLANRAASGDLRAANLLIALTNAAQEKMIQQQSNQGELHDTDDKVIQSIFKRLLDAPES
jgi:hypothetical protein